MREAENAKITSGLTQSTQAQKHVMVISRTH